MTSYLEKMLLDFGPLDKFRTTPVPLHYNSDGPSKSVDWETAIILNNFVQWKRPETIVELGSFRGYSTAWLLLGAILNDFGQVHTFEVFKEGAYGMPWYDRYELPRERLTYHEIPGGIWNFPKRIPPLIDLLFHDTEHFLEPTRKEMELLTPRIPVGGVMLFDDMCFPDYRPMQDYLNGFFESTLNWSWTVLQIGHGLGIAERIA